eukprot:TRINITY_DN11331_c0_g1_i1.p1 TRINITY_DN11331_c0_g1~~TRINITY_DN11331_c0_g1_i1.p1  ORF type:complete len:257 (-),score=66.80 TRINITY_DN11331_c0_g1_i1:163-933(-)
MDAKVSELQADVDEVQRMLDAAKRPAVRSELQRVLTKLTGELKALDRQNAAVSSTPAAAAEAAPSEQAKAVPVAAPHVPAQVDVRSAGPWTEITTFAEDLGGYDKPTVTVDVRFKGIEQLPAESITCDFTTSSFDLKIFGYEGKNHRMLKTNLEKDIVVAESSVRVKKNHVIVTLQKVKGQYGYDSWSNLCAKGKRKETKKDESPQDSLMGMMKDMYDEGDDNMKKIIGEAMLKSQRGEKYDPKDTDSKFDTKMMD